MSMPFYFSPWICSLPILAFAYCIQVNWSFPCECQSTYPREPHWRPAATRGSGSSFGSTYWNYFAPTHYRPTWRTGFESLIAYYLQLAVGLTSHQPFHVSIYFASSSPAPATAFVFSYPAELYTIASNPMRSRSAPHACKIGVVGCCGHQS